MPMRVSKVNIAMWLSGSRLRRGGWVFGGRSVEDRVAEVRIEPLADTLRRLGDAVPCIEVACALVRPYRRQRLQQLGRPDLSDGLVPDRRGHVVLEAREPLRRV